jgi:hypothetical protein
MEYLLDLQNKEFIKHANTPQPNLYKNKRFENAVLELQMDSLLKINHPKIKVFGVNFIKIKLNFNFLLDMWRPILWKIKNNKIFS